jgi:probable HAF family extracellular repeat protein
MSTSLAAMLGALPLLAAAGPAGFSYEYASGKYSYATALNDAGHYAVNNQDSTVPYRTGSISTGTSSDSVGTLGGTESEIRALNNKDEAVGQSTTASGLGHAFLYSGGRMRDLTTAHGIGVAVAINDRGDIGGQTGYDNSRALVLRNGSVDIFGPPSSSVGDINGKGDAVGAYIAPGQGDRAFVYSDGRRTDLPSLGGSGTYGTGINDAGSVSGYGITGEGRVHAWLYDGKAMTDLTPSAADGRAYDINNLGQVVGEVGGRAFLYDDGQMTDLNTLIDPHADLLLTSAFDINERGQILSRSCDRTGVFCYGTVLLSPVPAVPEPSIAVMLIAGLGLMGARRVAYGLRGYRAASSWASCGSRWSRSTWIMRHDGSAGQKSTGEQALIRPRLTLLLCLATLAAAAHGQQIQPHHHGATEHGKGPPTFVASTAKPFAVLMDDAMAVMEEGMRRAPMDGVPEHDFVAMMIPHHQGAIDMAKVLLLRTTDPELRNLAQGIITEQQNEIQVMQAWLRRHAAPAPAGSPSH